MKLFSQFLLSGYLLLASSLTLAQSDSPFFVEHYGNYIHMMKVGEAPGRIPLQPMAAQKHLYGLGALKSLQGEIIILDGNILISRGNTNDGYATKVTSHDSATLLITAIVKDWVAVPLPHAMNKTEFEKFVLKTAIKNGISTHFAFPFMIKGEVNNLKWHVINGFQQRANEAEPYVRKQQFRAISAKGTLLGFYAGNQLEGIISHGGDPFHIHFVDADACHTGHVDAYEIGANATLFLPKAPIK